MTATPRNPLVPDATTRASRLAQSPRVLAVSAILIFMIASWRSPFMFYSGDDMMNMYKAWQIPVPDLLVSIAAFWKPAYRPLGGFVYRAFYGVFGFHPLPLYVFSWALLIINTGLLYVLVARITRAQFHPLVTCVLATVHGMYLDLYYSAGTIYDHLSAFFCLVALVLWFEDRPRKDNRFVLLFCAIILLTIAACDSKENAVALPVLLLAGELALIPRAPGTRWRVQLLIPIAISAAIVAIFIVARVAGTSDLSLNPAYQPRPSALISNLGVYLGYFSYGALSKPGTAVIILLAIAAITTILRSAPMIFGCIWFAATLLPVAFIPNRSGYVLYLPMMGMGLWASDLLYQMLRRIHVSDRSMPVAAMLASVLLCIWHATHWPTEWDTHYAESVTTRTFRLRYPHLQRGAKLLFITDPFPRDAWDLLFNMRLMYHDDNLIADRVLSGMPVQRPGATHQVARYDHVFMYHESGGDPYYVELATAWPMADFTPAKQ